jgi:hypothetical protein
MISIEINPSSTLKNIQEKFSTELPYLKLEFFHKAHRAHEGSPKSDLITDTATKVGALSSLAMDLVLVIHRNMKVGELEKLFEDKLHLHVQVFSKSGKSWLESLHSDDLSLQQLNDRALERNSEIVEDAEPTDYHEQE